jgi:hypothetical protein
LNHFPIEGAAFPVELPEVDADRSLNKILSGVISRAKLIRKDFIIYDLP